MAEKLLKFVEKRKSSPVKGLILKVIREIGNKYQLLGEDGEWIDSPGLKMVFQTPREFGDNIFPAGEKDVEKYLDDVKAMKKMKPVTAAKVPVIPQSDLKAKMKAAPTMVTQKQMPKPKIKEAAKPEPKEAEQPDIVDNPKEETE